MAFGQGGTYVGTPSQIASGIMSWWYVTSGTLASDTTISIPIPAAYQGWKRYRVYLSLQATNGGGSELLALTCNTDTGANYKWCELSGTGAAAQSATASGANYIRLGYITRSVATDWEACQLQITQKAANQYKGITWVGGNVGDTTYIIECVGRWENTANNITSIELKGVNTAALKTGCSWLVVGNND